MAKVIQHTDAYVLHSVSRLCYSSVEVHVYFYRGLETGIMDFNKIMCSAICERKRYRRLTILDEVWSREITQPEESDLFSIVLWLQIVHCQLDTKMIRDQHLQEYPE